MDYTDQFMVIGKSDYLEKHSKQGVPTKLNWGVNNNTTDIRLSPTGLFSSYSTWSFQRKDFPSMKTRALYLVII